MIRILTIDTCTDRLLLGTRDSLGNDQCLTFQAQGRHAQGLLPAISEFLAGDRPEVIGVSLGPGSFTGVRIGLATAKGLARGWKIPLVGLDNLAAMGATRQRLQGAAMPILSVIDGRKGRFYGTLIRGDSTLIPPSDLTPDNWKRHIEAMGLLDFAVTGPHAQALASHWPEVPDVLDLADWTPALLDQAQDAWLNQRFLDETAGPRYLRLSEAEEAQASRDKPAH